jgi:putative integral membrane protein (TIGR02587 family)
MQSTGADGSRAQAGERGTGHHFGVGLARAVGGAMIFALPILMTMEMWSLGFYMDRVRLAILIASTLPLLVGLSHFSGFEETFDFVEDLVDALVAYAVGFVTAAVILLLLGVLNSGQSLDEIVGKLALQAVPGSIGALLAQSTFGGQRKGGDEEDEPTRPSGYWSQIFLMGVGALFLAFNIAPTEEIVLLAYMMTPWHIAALALLSLVAMHAFVYAVDFSGGHELTHGHGWLSVFLRYSVVGFAVALLISAYVLWTFGRLDDTSLVERVTSVLVLGFPASIGAAAARLIL